MKDKRVAFDQCVKTIRKEDLNVKLYLLETDYVPAGFRRLIEDCIEQIETYILKTGIYMIEEDFLETIDVQNIQDNQELIKLYTRKVTKYPALYILSAMDVCTKLVMESKDMVLSVNEKEKETYLFVKKDGFVRQVRLVFTIQPSEETNYNHIPKAKYIIKDTKTGIILGFEEIDLKEPNNQIFNKNSLLS